MGLSGADLEQQKMLQLLNRDSSVGLDGARLQQMVLEAASDEPGLINYCENVSTQVTTAAVSPSSTFVEGSTLWVPPTPTRDVLITWGGLMGVTVIGPGYMNVILYEFINGVATNPLETAICRVNDSGVVSSAYDSFEKSFTLGKTTTWREFGLQATVVRPSGALATNLNNGNGANRTFIRAEAL